MATTNTTIRINTETRKILANIGSKGETYNDVIIRLLKLAVKHREIDKYE